MQGDELRSARILFRSELASGRIGEAELDHPAVRRAVRWGWMPRPVRLAQRAAVKFGRLTYEQAVVEPFMRARRELLGEAEATGPPRLLVRVDEFPHYLGHGAPRFERVYASEHYLAFHGALAAVGVPYLLAVSPRVSHNPLDPTDTEWRPLDEFERGVLRRLVSDGVEFAMHGLKHQTRHPDPSRHSEIAGLGDTELKSLLETSTRELTEAGVETRVFVPPYNRFDPRQYDELARRFDVVCGGPENVLLWGYRRTPLWRGDAVYMPSYAPFYGDAESLAPAIERLVELQAPVWVPVALHWGWEFENDWRTLEQLATLLAPHARPWSEFFAEMQASSLDV